MYFPNSTYRLYILSFRNSYHTCTTPQSHLHPAYPDYAIVTGDYEQAFTAGRVAHLPIILLCNVFQALFAFLASLSDDGTRGPKWD